MKNRSKGFSLVEILIGVGLFAALSLLIVGAQVTLSTQSKKGEDVATLGDIRQQIIANLNSDNGFRNTVQKNAAFSCIISKGDCAGAGGEFVVYDSNRVEVNSLRLPFTFSSTEGNQGFSAKGIACATFDAANGNDACPFRYVSRWAAICGQRFDMKTNTMVTDATCFNPSIKLDITFSFAPKDPSKFGSVNPRSMDISLVKSQVESDPQKACEMAGGIFTPEASIQNRVGSCTLASQAVNCIDYCVSLGHRSGTGFVIGFTADGAPECSCGGTPTPIDCTPTGIGGVLSAVTATGGVCTDGIVPLLISSGAINLPPVAAPWLPPAQNGDSGGGS